MQKPQTTFFPFCQTVNYGLKQRTCLWAVSCPHGFEKATKLPGMLGVIPF